MINQGLLGEIESTNFQFGREFINVKAYGGTGKDGEVWVIESRLQS